MLSEFLCLSFSLVFCYFTSHLLFFTHICGSWKVLKFSGVIVPLHNLKQLSPPLRHPVHQIFSEDSLASGNPVLRAPLVH